MRRAGLLLFLLTLALGAQGCVPVALEVVHLVVEDRSAEQQVHDLKIHTGILRRFIGLDEGLPVDVNTDVWESRVLLTGLLTDPRLREEVERLVREDSRVRAVYNEIQIAPTAEIERRRRARRAGAPSEEESDSVQVGRFVSDLWLEGKIKAKLLATEGIHSVNYRWQAVRNRVYIIGRAQSEREKKAVLHILRTSGGVLGVRDFIEVGSRRGIFSKK